MSILNQKIPLATKQHTASDMVAWHIHSQQIFKRNSGTNSVRITSIDSTEPPCPRPDRQTTRMKITDDSSHVSHISAGFTTNDLVFMMKFIPPAGNYELQLQENARGLYKVFIGLKSAIQCIDNYRLRSRGALTGINSQLSTYQFSDQRTIKSRDELTARPNMFSLYEDVHGYNSNKVCGIYVDIHDMMNPNGFEIRFPGTFQHNDYSELEGIEYYCNGVFGSLDMEIAIRHEGVLVYCMADPVECARIKFNPCQVGSVAFNTAMGQIFSQYGVYDREFT